MQRYAAAQAGSVDGTDHSYRMIIEDREYLDGVQELCRGC